MITVFLHINSTQERLHFYHSKIDYYWNYICVVGVCHRETYDYSNNL